MRFVLIDRIDRIDPGRSAQGHKRFPPDADVFRDHFPGYPLVPGVLQVEALAQLGGRLVEATVRETSRRRTLPVLAKVDRAKFIRPVRPGERLDLAVELGGVSGDAARVSGVATVDGKKTAVADIMYAVLDVGVAGELLDEAQQAKLFAWMDQIWRELRGEA